MWLVGVYNLLRIVKIVLALSQTMIGLKWVGKGVAYNVLQDTMLYKFLKLMSCIKPFVVIEIGQVAFILDTFVSSTSYVT